MKAVLVGHHPSAPGHSANADDGPSVPGLGTSRRALPAVEKVLQALGPVALPRATVVAAVRREIAALRHASQIPEFDVVLSRTRSELDRLSRLRLQPVINGTGVLLHTNLGRAPLGRRVLQTLARVAASYTNLEYDLAAGERGSRGGYLEHNLALLCRAEAATVVNNCAAALILVLRHLTRHKPEVVISRGELVQIGGGFRIPEILEASGARLREVGTTNHTAIEDYARALNPETGLILKVHRSNFCMDGFVASPPTAIIAALARKQRLPFVEDLGSGAILNTGKFPGVEHEPTPAEVLQKGVDLVTFSGDKLLGGPQAGIIAGKAKWIGALKREPLFRALRCDKLVLGALQATVEIYLEESAESAIPILAMLQTSTEALRARAGCLITQLSDLPLKAGIGEAKARMGGGSLPRSGMPSVTLDLLPLGIPLAELAKRLRSQTPPVIGYLSGGRFKLDLRTIFSTQDHSLLAAIKAALV